MTRLLLVLLLAGLFPWGWWRRLWWALIVERTIALYIEFPVSETEEPDEIPS